MARKADYVVQYRRKKEGKTDYKTRLNLLKSETTRLIIRPTNKHVIAQLIDYKPEGDVVVASAHSQELKGFGWERAAGNLPASYLTGFLCGLRGQKKGVKTAILDMGLLPSIKGSRCYATLKGAIDSGLKIPADESVFPTEDRIAGKHIDEKVADDVASVKQKISESLKK